ncbi:MAG: ribosome biogenesis GTPase YlqF [Myxococcales bacterium]|nr:ribosome biogenesis GTPase YlqF [Myxococcales bacterium]MBL0197968.1 ribosome biogenesis GTPase YlqF [Myxococcales bacterium]HQY62894.1 ribosome biogenesis GTPase YlqF [Polyangiaceae bacterium]
MSIQWFPGHMTQARRAIADAMPGCDVVVEVLDARMPRASENPLLADLRGAKPCVKILGKSDLADPEVTTAWLQAFAEHPEPTRSHPEGSVLACALTTKRPGELAGTIHALCARQVPHRSAAGKAIRAMIVGIPNVGKSTIINTLMGRKVAAVGDKPAVTKSTQKVVLKSGLMTLLDNPGIMWPRIDDPRAALCLAFGGAIPETAIDFEEVGMFGAGLLLQRYPGLVVARYKLDTTPASAEALLTEIGRRRGGLRSGGVVDLHKAADILIHDFRQGTLGRISLEGPRRPAPRAPATPEGTEPSVGAGSSAPAPPSGDLS